MVAKLTLRKSYTLCTVRDAVKMPKLTFFAIFNRHFNDRAVYTCDDGYQIVGLEQVICNSDGKWSGAQPTCKQAATNSQSRYYCGEPTIIPNAKHNGSAEQVKKSVAKQFSSNVFHLTLNLKFLRNLVLLTVFAKIVFKT